MTTTIALALSKAQLEIKPPKKNCEVTYSGRKFRYADLSAVFDAIREPLAKNELAVTQVLEVVGEYLYLKTMLIHSSGASLQSYYPMPDTSKPQDFGSALTYARRYSLSSIVGIASEDDDDAQGGQDAPKAKPIVSQKPPNLAPQPKPKTNPLRDELVGLIEYHNFPVEETKELLRLALKSTQYKRTDQMNDDELMRCIDYIKNYLAAKN